MSNIVETATTAGSFKTLVAAVQAAGLGETLSGAGPFTVFAPNDDAFAKLPAGVVQALLGNIPRLTEILTFHVVPGKLMAADVVKLTSATTVQGQDLTIAAQNTVTINGANVITPNIEADNGVIHVIDQVILPQ
jgi:uncharacterized surface protein with fasciclin (FAS1) repeats